MYGIPNMKLDKSVVSRRIDKLAAEGIEFRCGVEIGKDVSGDELKTNFDAVVLCCGARQPRALGVDDKGLNGVVPALDYLTAATKAVLAGTASVYDAKGLEVVVVGNGDTATDCVATALRQGAKSVTQLVRKPSPTSSERVWPYRSAGEKTDYGQEEAAAVLGHDPRLYATTVTEMRGDEQGALRSLVIRTGDLEREIPAQLLLTATGFSGAEAAVASAFSLSRDGRGRVGGDDYRTSDPKVVACGDLRRGPSLVVWAIAEGRECARAVDLALEGYTNL